MTNLEIAWLAGLLEGEGFFGVTNNRVSGKVYRYPRVGVSMTDKDVIDRVAAIWGNKVLPIKPSGVSKKMSYRVLISGQRAIDQMLLLRPYMGERRAAQIDAALSEWEHREPTSVARKRSCQKAAEKRARAADGRFVADL